MDSEDEEVQALARAAGLILTAAEVDRVRAALHRSREAMTELRTRIGNADEPAPRFSVSPSDHDRS
jgi:hypothetical protein